MANDDYRDDDELRAQAAEELRQRQAAAAVLPRTPAAVGEGVGGGGAPVATGTPPVSPTLPTTRPNAYERDLETRYAELNRKLNPPPAQTGWGKFGRVMGTIGQDIGTAIRPDIMANIPGTTLNRRIELARTGREIGAEQERQSVEALRGAQTEEAKARTAQLGYPDLEPLTGPTAESPSGYRLWHNKRAPFDQFWVGPNENPGDIYQARRGAGAVPAAAEQLPTTGAQETPAAPTQAAPETMPKATTQAPAPTAAPTPAPAPQKRRAGALPEGEVPGPAKTLTAEQKLKNDFFAAMATDPAKRTDAQNQLITEHTGEWGKLVPVTPEQMASGNADLQDKYRTAQALLGKNAPRPPTVLPTDSIERADEKRDKYDTQIYNEGEKRKSLVLQQELGDLHATVLRDQIQKKQEDARSEANMGYINLYMQEAYRDAFNKWVKSGNYGMKDKTIIENVLNEQKPTVQMGGSFAPVVGALAGAGAGPAGIITGATAGVLLDTLKNASSGLTGSFLDALKKTQISKEGYDAMAAYVNALPGRMAYELTTQGLKASAMRSSQMMGALLDTVPKPNTPSENFDSAFNRYYKPMKAATEGKYAGRLGYTPPPRELIVPTGGEGGAHNFTYKGRQFNGVSDDVYKKYKDKPGFKE